MFGTVKVLFGQIRRFDKLEPAICSTLNREGVNITSQRENFVKEITVHVISVLVVD